MKATAKAKEKERYIHFFVDWKGKVTVELLTEEEMEDVNNMIADYEKKNEN